MCVLVVARRDRSGEAEALSILSLSLSFARPLLLHSKIEPLRKCSVILATLLCSALCAEEDRAHLEVKVTTS